jgi:hypothetical protein
MGIDFLCSEANPAPPESVQALVFAYTARPFRHSPGVQEGSKARCKRWKGDFMKSLKWFALTAAFVAFLLAATPVETAAQVSINVQIGPEPVCPYGYFNYAPYSCAPFGYYGPQWYVSGAFIGAGPWFHGPDGFRGYVDHAYDPRYGYRGPLPPRGERADWGRHQGWERQFRGTNYRHEYRHDNGNHYGQYKDHGDHGNGHGNGHDNGHGNDHGNGRGNGHGHD